MVYKYIEMYFPHLSGNFSLEEKTYETDFG